MKKIITLIIAVHCSLFTVHLLAQSCLPEGIIFTTQAQVDSFQINYPGCTEIEGDVEISGNDITNLNGLNVLTSIGGDLEIKYNDALTSLTSLDNVTSIGGDLSIDANPELGSLMGLDNLNTISGSLEIGYFPYPEGAGFGGNPSLTDLEGLENLSSIGGDLSISNNATLNSLAGLENLDGTSLNNIFICHNPSLNNCDIQSLCDFLVSPGGSVNIYNNATGCDNPAEVASNCGITLSCLPYGNYYFLTQSDIDNFESNYPGCAALEGDVNIGISFPFASGITDLSGLSAITSIGGNLNIKNADSLTSLVGLEGLTSTDGNIRIYGNAKLENMQGMEGLTLIGGGLSIDGYPEFEGSNSSLTSLDGLENLSSLGDYLKLIRNYVLTDITGLEGLISIGGDLLITGNRDLTNLDGLESLTSIGGDLQIGWNLYHGRGNRSLTSLTGLMHLNSIGGILRIQDNDSLTSLSGIDNVDAASIDNLHISYNWSLSTCEVESVCAYLAAPNGIVEIEYNAPGCSSPEEVQDSCVANHVNIDEQYIQENIILYPNPATHTISLNTQPGTEVSLLEFIDSKGSIVEHRKVTDHQLSYNISNFPKGLYFIRICTNKGVEVKKLIIQ